MHRPRNPVARSPLLRKGGPHQRSPSAIRASQRRDIQTAVDAYRQRESARAPGRTDRGDPDALEE